MTINLKGLTNAEIQIRDGKAVMEHEGYEYSMDSAQLHKYYESTYIPPGGALVIPDGVKFMRWRKPYLLAVHEHPPMLRNTRWITKDSPSAYGAGTVYRPIRLSMPYTVTISTYQISDNGAARNTGANQLFFRTNMLKNVKDNLFYPSLLNVSVVGQKLDETWICTQYLKTATNDTWQDVLVKLLEHLWHGAFNYSSEHHEGASWFTRYAQAGIKEITPVENWETASAAPMFGYKFKNWLPCAYNLEEAIERTFKRLNAQPATELKQARVIENMAYHLLNYGTKVELNKKKETQ